MKLSEQDLTMLRDHAITRYTAIPQVGRLPDMKRDLLEEERRSLAYLEGSINVLNRLGLINQEALAKLDLRVLNVTNGHDVIDEAMEGVSART